MKSRTLIGVLIGLVSAGVGIGTGQLIAGLFVRPAAVPVIAVGNRIITLTPESAKRAAIGSAGTSDKTILVVSIYILLFVFGTQVGIAALRKIYYGLAGIAAMTGFGIYCAITADASRGTDVIPTIIAGIVSGAALFGMARAAREGEAPPEGWPPPALANRRLFLQGTGAAAGFALFSGVIGKATENARFNVSGARKKVVLPAPASPAPTPTGADLGKSGQPWDTPNTSFYRIDRALTVPQLNPAHWSLRIHGMVDKEIRLTYAELLARPMLERWITLCCVSNWVGGNLISNAKWLGASLADVLREAGIQAGADQLLMTAADGMTIGAPAKVVMDGRDALLAVGMNDAPLPLEHGFPVRTVVPGLYGYVSACKWITDIEVTTFNRAAAYWVQGGWAQQAPVLLESRIDTPHSGKSVAVGTPVPIAGVAWDQHVGVSKVEIQIDDGPWLDCRLATVPSTDTWRQWVYLWTPTKAGSFRVRVRATDAKGNPQTTQTADSFPSGATGLHTITVRAQQNS